MEVDQTNIAAAMHCRSGSASGSSVRDQCDFVRGSDGMSVAAVTFEFSKMANRLWLVLGMATERRLGPNA
jgi:hypothetical protein